MGELQIPVIFRLTTDNQRDIYFLISEHVILMDCVAELKNSLHDYSIKYKDCSHEELVLLAEQIIGKYGGTVIPFTLFNIKY